MLKTEIGMPHVAVPGVRPGGIMLPQPVKPVLPDDRRDPLEEILRAPDHPDLRLVRLRPGDAHLPVPVAVHFIPPEGIHRGAHVGILIANHGSVRLGIGAFGLGPEEGTGKQGNHQGKG